MEFKPSAPLTIGVELEVQLVDERDYSLKEASYKIFERYRSPLVHKEFLSSMVEFVSSPHQSPAEAVEELFGAISEVAQIGREEGFLLAASGTHPFALPEEVKITEDDRYKRLLEEFQEVLRNFLIYGLHIHVGFPTKEAMINGYNHFVQLAPLFLALSTSSPFFRGKLTGIYSYRSKLFEQLPRAGVPQHFSSFEEFSELVSILKESGAIESLKDIWWDVRPRPDFGTVELRICDAVPTKERIEALLTLAVMVAAISLKEEAKPVFHQINVQNKWNAARHGLKGFFITPDGRSTRISTYLLKVVASYAKLYGKSLKEGARILERLTTKPTPAQLQIDSFKREGSLKSLVELSLLEV